MDFGLTATLMCLILLFCGYYCGYKSGYNLGEQQAIAEFMATWGLDGGGDRVGVVTWMREKIWWNTLMMVEELKGKETCDKHKNKLGLSCAKLRLELAFLLS